MPTLRALLVSLGPSGATANARAVLDQRAGDERAIAALEARMDGPAPSGAEVVAPAA
jgi:hypothetical protein